MIYDEVKFGSAIEMAGMPPGLVDWREGLYLSYIVQNHYDGAGEIIDAGSFLGGSAWALSEGLRKNAGQFSKAGRLHAFDLFTAWDEPTMNRQQTAAWINRSFGAELDESGSFRNAFLHNIRDHIDFICIHEGYIEDVVWGNYPVEILFIDAGKSIKSWNSIVNNFYPQLIVGKSIVIQQDWHHAWLPHIIITQEYLSCYFDVLEPRINDSASFKYSRKISDAALHKAKSFNFSLDEQISLINNAIQRFSSFKKEAFIELAAVELYRQLGRYDDARAVLKNLRKEESRFCDSDQFRRYCDSISIIETNLG